MPYPKPCPAVIGPPDPVSVAIYSTIYLETQRPEPAAMQHFGHTHVIESELAVLHPWITLVEDEQHLCQRLAEQFSETQLHAAGVFQPPPNRPPILPVNRGSLLMF